MKQSTKQFLGVIAASGLVLGAVATAVGQGMGMGPGMGGASVATTTERLAQVKSALGITAAQESAWMAYEQAVTNQSALMSSHRESMMGSGMPPVADQRAAMHQQGTQMMQQTAQARQDLYSVLTPAQKAKADNLIGGDFGPRRGM